MGEDNITITNSAVPLTGTIQLRTLQKKLPAVHFQSGFASRLLLCRLPTTAKTWTEADVSETLEIGTGRYSARFTGLQTARGRRVL